ncbi:hypothetical protein [Orientia tsutsugamushi]|uniref:hypothetical protein n=1 Tax=Orientia tsutsugamushi TaxID=784 RepID=UPI000A8E0E15|nr:hypothetical protein [Orientia tsutsugamushi]
MPLFIYYYYYYLYSFHISILCTYFLRSCYTAYCNYGGSRRYGEKAYQHTQRVSMI